VGQFIGHSLKQLWRGSARRHLYAVDEACLVMRVV
jgi:hypothetical protein